MNYRIKDLNKDEKPREKMLKFEPTILTDSELLAIIIGTGGKNSSALDISREMLTSFGGFRGLVETQISQIQNIKHINKAKACAIYAAIEIGLRIRMADSDLAQKELLKPKDVFMLMQKDLYKKTKEYLYLLSLNSRNKLIATDLISMGTVNEALISPREIFKQALVRNAVAIILVHNHPSNDPNASDNDISVTKTITRCGVDMGIPLIDHIIIANDTYTSLKAQNHLEISDSKKKGGVKNEKEKTSNSKP